MRINRRTLAATGAAALATGAAVVGATHADAAGPEERLRHAPLARHRRGGLPAPRQARVVVQNQGPVEVMKIHASGLPKHTDFDLFVIQVPNAPFGIGWYQGDLETNRRGRPTAPSSVGSARRPSRSPRARPRRPRCTTDPSRTPRRTRPFGPIHTFHLGLWFNSPRTAGKAGCPTAVTPFNGEHNAGVQVLNTAAFPDAKGPLGRLKP